MSRLTRQYGTRKNNIHFDAPDYGSRDERCMGYRFGRTVTATSQESRIGRAFYPVRSNSGTWVILLRFLSPTERDSFQSWLALYFQKVSDPYQHPLSPMTVTIPSRAFSQIGYPSATLEYGDSFGTVVYDLIVPFLSVIDVSVSASAGAKYIPPVTDAAALFFAPSNFESTALVNGTGGSAPKVF